MDGQIREHEIFSMNIDDLDVDELERRLEMAVAAGGEGCSSLTCSTYSDPACDCSSLGSCVAYRC